MVRRISEKENIASTQKSCGGCSHRIVILQPAPQTTHGQLVLSGGTCVTDNDAQVWRAATETNPAVACDISAPPYDDAAGKRALKIRPSGNGASAGSGQWEVEVGGWITAGERAMQFDGEYVPAFRQQRGVQQNALWILGAGSGWRQRQDLVVDIARRQITSINFCSIQIDDRAFLRCDLQAQTDVRGFVCYVKSVSQVCCDRTIAAAESKRMAPRSDVRTARFPSTIIKIRPSPRYALIRTIIKHLPGWIRSNKIHWRCKLCGTKQRGCHEKHNEETLRD